MLCGLDQKNENKIRRRNEIMYGCALRYLKGFFARIDDINYPSGPTITSGQNSSCQYFDEYSHTRLESTIHDYGYNEVINNYVYENGQCEDGVATFTPTQKLRLFVLKQIS